MTKRLKPKSVSSKIKNENKIESERSETGSLETTGHLGDVMKESMRTAYTVAKTIMLKKMPENDFFEHAHIHVHVPEVNFLINCNA